MTERTLDALDERLRSLGVPGAHRRRVVAEARDHLEELSAATDPETAVVRFGNVGEVARLVAAELATAATRRAALDTFGALALVGIAFAAALELVPLAGGWPDVFAGRISALGPVVAIALVVLSQVAFVSGCLAALRAVRIRGAGAVSDAELSLLRRRSAVALLAGAGTLAALAAFALDDRGLLAGWWVDGTLAASVLLLVPVALAGARLVLAARPAAQPGGEPGDVFDDLAPAFALAPIRRLALPDHPWRFALLTAAAVALAGTLAGWVAEGDVASGFVRGGFEAIALLICFSVLGRPLGLRRSPR
jgi:hypothetical protein